MENDKLKKTYLSFYVPALVTCVVDYIGGFIDNALGGRFLGEEVFSSLSVTVPVMLLLSMAGNFFSGGSILASQELGAGNREKARSYYRKTILLTATAAVLLAGAIIAFSGTICRFLCKDASEAVLASAKQYLIRFCPAAVPFLLIFVLTGFLRLDQAQDIPMKATVAVTVCDIVLDFLLTPKWGVRGLAAATTISYLLGLLPFLSYFARKNRLFALSGGKSEDISLGHLLATGAPVAMNRFGSFVNSVFLNYMAFSLASNIGGVVINVRSQCMTIAISIIVGTIQAGAPSLGFFCGEGNLQGQKEMSKLVIRSALLHAAALALFCIFLNRIIPGLFGIGTESKALGAAAFAVACLGIDLILKAVITGTVIIYQITGREKMANVLSAMETLFLLIPLELVFGLLFGINGLWTGALLSDLIMVILICLIQRHNHKTGNLISGGGN